MNYSFFNDIMVWKMIEVNVNGLMIYFIVAYDFLKHDFSMDFSFSNCKTKLESGKKVTIVMPSWNIQLFSL